MPSSTKPLWLLTGLLLVTFPALNFFYWPQVLRSGVLPSESDSIAIPMFRSVILTIVASPIILSVAWLCFRRYNSEVRISAFRRDRLYRSVLATVTFGGSALILAMGAVHEALDVQPWYEYVWSLYMALWVPWLLALRAALIEQEEHKRDRFAAFRP